MKTCLRKLSTKIHPINKSFDRGVLLFLCLFLFLRSGSSFSFRCHVLFMSRLWFRSNPDRRYIQRWKAVVLNWPVRKYMLVSCPPLLNITFVFELHVVGTITAVLEKSRKPRFFHLFLAFWRDNYSRSVFTSCPTPVSLIAFSGSP